MRAIFARTLTLIAVIASSVPLRADTVTISKMFGIDAEGIRVNGITLNGANTTIGQVERNRPGDPDIDLPANSNTFIVPTRVYNQTTRVTSTTGANQNIGDHAERVASVMIDSQAASPTLPRAPTGVAPNASLISSAYLSMAGTANYSRTLLSMQVVATNDPRAINLSFGFALPGGGMNGNGSSLLAQGLDWLSVNEKVGGFGTDSPNSGNNLYVIAAGNRGQTVPTPRDSYNGVVVGSTRQDANGIYDQVSAGTNFATGPTGGRHGIDLVAPGARVTTGDLFNASSVKSGTSLAAPMVTGTVSLLQQAANIALTGQALTDSSRSEVMKAILLNSTDKFTANGGAALGMEKTILNTTGQTWLQTHAGSTFNGVVSPGANDPSHPFDPQIGTGQLNASQAVREMVAGEQHVAAGGSGNVNLVGWDFSNTNGASSVEKYVFNQDLAAHSWVEITLDWDRVLTKLTNGVDSNTTAFATGDTFRDNGFDPLSLYLLPIGANSTNQALWASVSTVDNDQQVFFQVPDTAEYQFWVVEGTTNNLGNAARATDYGIAWRAVAGEAVAEPASIVMAAIGVAVIGLCKSRRLVSRARSAI